MRAGERKRERTRERDGEDEDEREVARVFILVRRTAAAGISRPEIDGDNGDTEQRVCLRGDDDLPGGASLSVSRGRSGLGGLLAAAR